MARQIKNAAVVNNVVDVSLLGTADLGYWQKALQAEQLEPLEKDGHAQILFIAADAKFMGLRFRELSFSVFARDTSGLTDLSGSFLLRAFNSRRSFAWIERVIFKTPYYHGEVMVQADPPLVQLELPEVSFAARSELRLQEKYGTSKVMGWHGPVFLPSRQGCVSAKRKIFFAQVRGMTEEFAFDPARDLLTLPNTMVTPFQALRESSFQPRQWFVRPAATHVKSKTYARGDCPPFVAETFDS